jgi:tRNA nucleotidyltransferase/poly(A) polymerase
MPIKRKPKNAEEKGIFDILNEIDHISHLNGIYSFVVGGFCRDEYLKKEHLKSSDIDLMAENYNSLILAGLVGTHFKTEIKYSHKSGTAKTIIDGIKFDFKSNIKKYEYLPFLRKTSLEQNNLSFDIISRDFTINTLAIGMRSWHMYDLLNMAKKDLDNKVLRTPIKSDFSIKNDPLIFLRALKFAIRDGYRISEELDEAMIKNKECLKKLPFEETKKSLLEYYGMNKKTATILYKKYLIKGFLDKKDIIITD